jgi:hypothetical protein
MNPLLVNLVLAPAAALTGDELRAIPRQILGLFQEWAFALILAAAIGIAVWAFVKTHSGILVATIIGLGIVFAAIVWRIDQIASSAPTTITDMVTGADSAELPNAPAAPAAPERPAGS